MDDDELESAIKIIKRASTEQIGTHDGCPLFRAEPIILHTVEGFSVVAFALPSVLEKWGGRVREVALDSACKQKYITRRTGTHRIMGRGD